MLCIRVIDMLDVDTLWVSGPLPLQCIVRGMKLGQEGTEPVDERYLIHRVMHPLRRRVQLLALLVWQKTSGFRACSIG